MQDSCEMEECNWLVKVLSDLKQLSKKKEFANLAPIVTQAAEAFVRESRRASLDAHRIVGFPATNMLGPTKGKK